MHLQRVMKKEAEEQANKQMYYDTLAEMKLKSELIKVFIFLL